jgi:hypothetical protein
MAQLYSRYEAGDKFPAGTITGSINGISGINPIIDRLNSITTDNNLVTGSVISGTSTNIFCNTISGNAALSGTTAKYYGSYETLSNGTGITVSNGSVISTDAIRTLSAGEGIDINSGSTIVAESASTTNKGVVELATTAEATTGTDTTRAMTCDAFKDATGTIASNLSGTSTTIIGSVINMSLISGTTSKIYGQNLRIGLGSTLTVGDTAEGYFPKEDGDLLYSSEVNDNQRNVTILESINQNTILSEDASVTDKTYTYASSDIFSDSNGYNNTRDSGTAEFSANKYIPSSTLGSLYYSDTSQHNVGQISPDEVAYTWNFSAKWIGKIEIDVKEPSNPTGHSTPIIQAYDSTSSSWKYVGICSDPQDAYTTKTFTFNPIYATSVRAVGAGGDVNLYFDEFYVYQSSFSSGTLITTSKTFSSNVKSILINANKVLNGDSTITIDVSSDGGSTWDVEDKELDTWIELDGDNTDIVIRFNLNPDGDDVPELYGYSYMVKI